MKKVERKKKRAVIMIKLMNEIFYMRTITVVIDSTSTTENIARTNELWEATKK